MIYSKVVPSTEQAIKIFEDVPMSTYFKIYTDKGIQSNGKCLTVFMDELFMEKNFDANTEIDALYRFDSKANIINETGLEYVFDEPKKLYFYIKNVFSPFNIYIDTSKGKK